MQDLMNPVKIIQWIIDFATGVIAFMNTSFNIPGVGNMPIWSFIVGSLGAILGYVFIKRLFL